MRAYKFTKYKSVIDPDQIFYALAGVNVDDSPVIKDIEGETYIEVTQDFENVNMFKLDNLTAVGTIERTY